MRCFGRRSSDRFSFNNRYWFFYWFRFARWKIFLIFFFCWLFYGFFLGFRFWLRFWLRCWLRFRFSFLFRFRYLSFDLYGLFWLRLFSLLRLLRFRFRSSRLRLLFLLLRIGRNTRVSFSDDRWVCFCCFRILFRDVAPEV